jgi:hypothetical protein
MSKIRTADCTVGSAVNTMRPLILSLLPAVLAIAAPTNFSGKWIVDAPGGSPGQPVTILILNQVGNQVTGSVSGRTDAFSASPANTEILDGVVENDTLTFYVWTGVDRPEKALYKGMLDGDEIKLTITGGVAGPGVAKGMALEWHARRAK